MAQNHTAEEDAIKANKPMTVTDGFGVVYVSTGRIVPRWTSTVTFSYSTAPPPTSPLSLAPAISPQLRGRDVDQPDRRRRSRRHHVYSWRQHVHLDCGWKLTRRDRR